MNTLRNLWSRDYSHIFQIVTNILAALILLFIGYHVKTTLLPYWQTVNIPALIIGMFPIIASFGMFIGVLISDKLSLMRIAYLFTMFSTVFLGA